MSVPDEAVEAACASFFRGLNHIHPESKSDMRAALEAAAPYIAAEAFDRGFTACSREWITQREDPTHPITRTNPYRSQA